MSNHFGDRVNKYLQEYGSGDIVKLMERDGVTKKILDLYKNATPVVTGATSRSWGVQVLNTPDRIELNVSNPHLVTGLDYPLVSVINVGFYNTRTKKFVMGKRFIRQTRNVAVRILTQWLINYSISHTSDAKFDITANVFGVKQKWVIDRG